MKVRSNPSLNSSPPNVEEEEACPLQSSDAGGSSKDEVRLKRLNVAGLLALFLLFMGMCATLHLYRETIEAAIEENMIDLDGAVPPRLSSPEAANTNSVQQYIRREEERQTPKVPKIEFPQGCLTSIDPVDRVKHRVPPPAGNVTLVCCESTKGVLNIAVHPTWAPIGASNFLNMVNTHYFESRVPMMRAIKGFLIQFGLSSQPETQKEYESTYLRGKGGLKDDPQWLPEGPPGRQAEDGTRRFKKGYFAYAGAGKNSRGTQLIVALQDSLYLGGGSPWEVPWGHLFGEESYRVLDSFYTGYGDKVSQGKIRNRGREYLDGEVPKLDYITACHVTAEGQPWRNVVVD